MQALAAQFEYTAIVCPFVAITKQNVVTAYTLPTVEFIPLPAVGGNKFKDKWNLIRTIPTWIKAFRKAKTTSDIVYMRFPNNLNIPGFFYFLFKKAKTFAQYTGTWKNYKSEPYTYRFQKWLLKNYFKGPVWIYTDELKNGGHIFKGFSPSYSLQDWRDEAENVEQRIALYRNAKIEIPVFVTVGALVESKNQQFILNAFKIFYRKGFAGRLFIVGDGPLKERYQQFINENNLQENIIIVGKKNPSRLRDLYRQSHFIIQAPLAEGFGKVPVEGFFHGLVPFLSKTALAEEMVGNNVRGFSFSCEDPAVLAELICKVMNEQHILPAMITNGRQYAKGITIESWVDNYIETLNKYFAA